MATVHSNTIKLRCRCGTRLVRWAKGQFVCPKCVAIAPLPDPPPPIGAALSLPILKPSAKWPGVKVVAA
jgi:hypothetical protein